MRVAFRTLGSVLLFLCVALNAAGAATRGGGPPEPFLHLYRESVSGGAQEVVADDMVSRSKIVVLQETLRRQARQYAKGDYPDPDGKTPAVNMLRAQASRISVGYVNLSRGGRIVFTTKDSRLVAALHEWMASTVRLEQRLHPGGGPGQGG